MYPVQDLSKFLYEWDHVSNHKPTASGGTITLATGDAGVRGGVWFWHRPVKMKSCLNKEDDHASHHQLHPSSTTRTAVPRRCIPTLCGLDPVSYSQPTSNFLEEHVLWVSIPDFQELTCHTQIPASHHGTPVPQSHIQNRYIANPDARIAVGQFSSVTFYDDMFHSNRVFELIWDDIKQPDQRGFPK